MSEPPEDRPQEADRLIYAGLLGLAAAGVLQLIDKDVLDLPLLIGAYCFAAAMPLLGVGLVINFARRAGTEVSRWREAVGLTGALIAVVGMGALLFHFGVGISAVFAAGCVVGLVLVRGL